MGTTDAPNFLDTARKLGSLICPHGDGDYVLTVYDLRNWATGFCLIRQEGQGEVHDIMVSREESGVLALILKEFAHQDILSGFTDEID